MKDASWFKPWTPLSQIPYQAIEVGDSIYTIAPSTYMFTVPHDREYMGEEHGPYATILAFAPSAGAVERSLNMAVELDMGEALDFSDIPTFGLTDFTYASLSKLSGVFESARYHGLTGQFIEISLVWGPIEFCFRNNALQPTDTPYVVRYQPQA
jgi:hypothetical protein